MTLLSDKCLETVRSRPRRRRRKAQTTVEFSLIILPFFAILFAIVDYAQIYFYKNSLQNGLREAARFATAGRIIQTTNTDGSPAYETNEGGVVIPKAINDASGNEASRNECIRWWFESNCVIKIPLSNIVITSAPTIGELPPTTVANAYGYLELTQTNSTAGVAGAPAYYGPGAANDYVQVTATYYLSTITPLFNYLGGFSRTGGYPVYVSAIVKNEPALLNFEHTNVYIPLEYPTILSPAP